MTVHFRRHQDTILITGQTFPHKEAIKALGARFNGRDKCWFIPYSPEAEAQVASLCEGLGGGSLGPVGDSDRGTAPGSGGPKETEERKSSPPPLLGRISGAGSGSSRPSPAPNTDALGARDPMAEADGISVSDLMARVEGVISRSFSAPVWVLGEIQNLRRTASGVYFSLAEQDRSRNAAATVAVNATLWKGPARLLEHRHGKEAMDAILVDGTEVRLLCQVTFYKGRGQVSLAVNDVDVSFTKGALALAREKLVKEIKARGLFDANRRLKIPAFPLRIGLISSDGSRAHSDFVHQLETHGYPGTVVFAAAASQGDKVVREVPRAIEALDQACCDLIVITRGGGSAADLRWFDAPEVAYGVCKAQTPIIAAIGHHEDECVAEWVAHDRCKTPTAAASYVAGCIEETRERIEREARTLSELLTRSINTLSDYQLRLGERLYLAASLGLEHAGTALSRANVDLERVAVRQLDHRSSALDRVAATLGAEALGMVAKIDRRLSDQHRRLVGLDPSPWLEKGWTQVFSGSGPVRTIANIAEGDIVRARLIDGTFEAKVTQRREKS